MLRALQTGLASACVPAVMVAMGLAYTLLAYPVGVLSERLNRRPCSPGQRWSGRNCAIRCAQPMGFGRHALAPRAGRRDCWVEFGI